VSRTFQEEIYPVRNNAPLEFLTGFTPSKQWKVWASLNFTVGGVAKRDNFHNAILSIDKN